MVATLRVSHHGQRKAESMQHLTVELLLKAYAHGHFPMDNDGRIEWYHPNPRGIIPLDDRFHVPGRLARTIRSGHFRVTTDTAFEQVVRACAVPRPEQPTTWISERIVAAYGALHARGYAHSVETWDGADLVGGLYGVAVGGYSPERVCLVAGVTAAKWRWWPWSNICAAIDSWCSIRSGSRRT